MRFAKTRLRQVSAAALIALMVSVVVGIWAWDREDRLQRSHLEARATAGALLFSSHELQSLTAQKADVANPSYAVVKARLVTMRTTFEGARFLYLMRYDPATGRVVYLADSEPAGSANESLPGDAFAEAGQMPGLRALLRNGKSAVEGPIEDSFGTFVTAYAVVAEGRGVVFFGADVEAQEWRRGLAFATVRVIGLCWLISAIPVLLTLSVRQRSASVSRIRKLCEAVEQSESAIIILGADTKVEYVNQGLCQQMGYAREELIGHDWRDFQADATPATVTTRIIDEAKEGRSWEGELVNRRQNGELYPARATLSPVRGPVGKIEGFIAVYIDMTETQRKQNELREAKERAERAGEAKGRFLATMSHEVRTPLNGIVGFTSLLLETALSTEQREYVQTIRTSAEALVHLTGDILDFSRIETGKLHLDPAPCDLRATLEDALDIFAGRAAEQGLELLHWVESDVPVQVLLDGGRLRQVLINLISNAVKFTAKGEVEVVARLLTGKSVSVAPFDDVAKGQLVAEFHDGGITLEFSVRDTGIGIAEGDGARLFHPFTQLDGSASRRYGGAGLGLAISRELVRLMGGDIRIESIPGRGATFIFTVRARPTGAPADAAAACALEGRRVALLAPHGNLHVELAQVLRLAAAVVRPCAAGGPVDEAELAVVDCDRTLRESLSKGSAVVTWQPERAVGLVDVTVSSEGRRALRQHFKMLLNKPVHHRTLVDVLEKAAQASTQFGSGLRVLVVEDDPVQQRLSSSVLETLGCRCQTAPEGASGIAELAARDYDLVLMDMHMEGTDGLTAVKRIRAGEAGQSRREVWIAAFTGDVRPEMREMAVQAGADDFLNKPLGLAGFQEAVKRFLGAKRPVATT